MIEEIKTLALVVGFIALGLGMAFVLSASFGVVVNIIAGAT